MGSSERREIKNNRQAWSNLRENLEANHLDLREIPVVIQFNKQDLAHTLDASAIHSVEDYSGIPCFSATAIQSKGVIETLESLVMQLWDSLCERQSIGERLDITRETFARHVAQIFGLSSRGHERTQA